MLLCWRSSCVLEAQSDDGKFILIWCQRDQGKATGNGRGGITDTDIIVTMSEQLGIWWDTLNSVCDSQQCIFNQPHRTDYAEMLHLKTKQLCCLEVINENCNLLSYMVVCWVLVRLLPPYKMAFAISRVPLHSQYKQVKHPRQAQVQQL